MKFIDSHCHIHDSEFFLENREEAYRLSIDRDVSMICIGTTELSSREAVEFAATHKDCYATVGVHPHDTIAGWNGIERLLEQFPGQIVGIGEIGLDYFYTHSPKEVQMQALRDQLALAQRYDLPVSFHVREAFDDFWSILDEFEGIRGVLHSFTDTDENLQKALQRGLYIGVNGISTFTKNEKQRKMYQVLPLRYILLETDAPYLTPAPIRRKMNIPAYVELVASHQAEAKNVSLEEVARITTDNARKLFGV